MTGKLPGTEARLAQGLSGNALWGGIILLIFAAGMALPLLVLALFWGRMPWVKRVVKPREVRVGPWRNTWTGVVSGILTIGLGVLLIVTNGTESLGGMLSASTQLKLEGWAFQATSGVSNWVVLLVVLSLAGIAFGLVRWRARQHPPAT